MSKRGSKKRGWRSADRSFSFKNWMYSSGCPVYCAHCMRPVSREKATVDHVVPVWAKGNDWTWNFVISCARCNQARATDDRIHWGGHHNPYCITGSRCECFSLSMRGKPPALHKDIQIYLGIIKYLINRWQLPALR